MSGETRRTVGPGRQAGPDDQARPGAREEPGATDDGAQLPFMSDSDGFDVRAYTRDPRSLRRGDLDLGAMQGLPTNTLLTLRHLQQVERGTLRLMRDLLVTPTHAESRVTAFLTTWAYEEYWIADALEAVLEDNNHTEVAHSTRLGRMRRGWDDRIIPTVDAIRTNLLGSDIVAGHMAVGLLDSLVARASYARVGVLEPRLASLIDPIVTIKDRHVEFYTDEAADRLAASVGARRLGQQAVRSWRWPGSRYGDPGYVQPVLRYLFADPSVRVDIDAADARVAALPGMADQHPIRRALGRFASRGARQ
ncbi:hypothetical protein OCAE111667_03065 [Occultella aeris]|uniref:Uncharacterized protein n=1 Tax=Occultella aeris TaxID=2761496 RepID=A0A7M4DD95_9MICO|nr:hypothetical protein [Occultella aeris]VZO34814.1 hypothetical protein HALOF300_00084 [Occultella aeris]